MMVFEPFTLIRNCSICPVLVVNRLILRQSSLSTRRWRAARMCFRRSGGVLRMPSLKGGSCVRLGFVWRWLVLDCAAGKAGSGPSVFPTVGPVVGRLRLALIRLILLW